MSVIAGWLVPHPPLIFPEVGRGREKEIKATVDAFRVAGAEIAAAAPDTIVVVSPHAAMYADYFHVSPGRDAYGDMLAYGVSGVKVHADYDEEFVQELERECEASGIPAGTQGERDSALDHATMIPVRFVNEAFSLGINTASPKGCFPSYVRVGVSGLPVPEHYLLGKAIAATSEKLGRKTVVIASGDLSHRLMDSDPYSYAPEGPEFDKAVCEVAGNADFGRLLAMDAGFLEKAGECGHRPLVVMAGALDRKVIESRLYSYEGPFGVGYGIASFVCAGGGESEDEGRAFLDQHLKAELEQAAARQEIESPHVALARATVENLVKTGRMYSSPEPLPEALTADRAGVFVSIKKHGALRGCIGTITPVTKNVGEEIRANAVSAATRDPRFNTIEEDELPFLEYSVDVLAPTEPVGSADALDPAKYGVIVSLGDKRGLLLPDLEGIEDSETQIRVAMRKAGIAEENRAKVRLERFEVVRYK